MLVALGSQAPQLKFAEVADVQPHPKSDRLKVCQIDVGPVTYKVRAMMCYTGNSHIRKGLEVGTSTFLPSDM